MNKDQLEKKLLHFTGKAIADFDLIQAGNRILVCLSGGKDSYTLLWLLRKLQQRAKIGFELFSYTLDQGQPGWQDDEMRAWLSRYDISYKIHRENTYTIVTDKVPENKTYCSLCSRLRRGIIYRYAL